MKAANARQIFDALPRKFSPRAAGDLDAVFQFDISGAGAGQWNVAVARGGCRVVEGAHPDPSVVLSMSEETWVRVATGEDSAVTAFLSGRIRSRGNLMLAQRLGQIFGLDV